jgi:hypothetical protein
MGIDDKVKSLLLKEIYEKIKMNTCERKRKIIIFLGRLEPLVNA